MKKIQWLCFHCSQWVDMQYEGHVHAMTRPQPVRSRPQQLEIFDVRFDTYTYWRTAQDPIREIED
jgi:hypothetical protein